MGEASQGLGLCSSHWPGKFWDGSWYCVHSCGIHHKSVCVHTIFMCHSRPRRANNCRPVAAERFQHIVLVLHRPHCAAPRLYWISAGNSTPFPQSHQHCCVSGMLFHPADGSKGLCPGSRRCCSSLRHCALHSLDGQTACAWLCQQDAAKGC